MRPATGSLDSAVPEMLPALTRCVELLSISLEPAAVRRLVSLCTRAAGADAWQFRAEAAATLGALARRVQMVDPLFPGDGRLVATPALKAVAACGRDADAVLQRLRYDKAPAVRAAAQDAARALEGVPGSHRAAAPAVQLPQQQQQTPRPTGLGATAPSSSAAAATAAAAAAAPRTAVAAVSQSTVQATASCFAMAGAATASSGSPPPSQTPRARRRSSSASGAVPHAPQRRSSGSPPIPLPPQARPSRRRWDAAAAAATDQLAAFQDERRQSAASTHATRRPHAWPHAAHSEPWHVPGTNV
eukprot:365238-Chlamydomonas_euryale.AAC.1